MCAQEQADTIVQSINLLIAQLEELTEKDDWIRWDISPDKAHGHIHWSSSTASC